MTDEIDPTHETLTIPEAFKKAKEMGITLGIQCSREQFVEFQTLHPDAPIRWMPTEGTAANIVMGTEEQFKAEEERKAIQAEADAKAAEAALIIKIEADVQARRFRAQRAARKSFNHTKQKKGAK